MWKGHETTLYLAANATLNPPSPRHRLSLRCRDCCWCWKLSAARTPPALTVLLAPICYSLSLLCLHTFPGEDNMLFWGFFSTGKWALKISFCQIHVKGIETHCFSWCWQQLSDPSGGLSGGRNGHRSCRNGSTEQQEAVPVSWTMTPCLPEDIQHCKWENTKL